MYLALDYIHVVRQVWRRSRRFFGNNAILPLKWLIADDTWYFHFQHENDSCRKNGRGKRVWSISFIQSAFVEKLGSYLWGMPAACSRVRDTVANRNIRKRDFMWIRFTRQFLIGFIPNFRELLFWYVSVMREKREGFDKNAGKIHMNAKTATTKSVCVQWRNYETVLWCCFWEVHRNFNLLTWLPVVLAWRGRWGWVKLNHAWNTITQRSPLRYREN